MPSPAPAAARKQRVAPRREALFVELSPAQVDAVVRAAADAGSVSVLLSGLAELARMLVMNTSTTHRYVSTLVAVGLLERDAETRRHRRAP